MGPVKGHGPGELPGCVCAICKDAPYKPGRLSPLQAQIETIRKPESRERIRRLLAYQGRLTDFAASEGITPQALHSFVARLGDIGGPLGNVVSRWRLLRIGLTEADLVQCTACCLRGHKAGEPGRCSGLTGTGIGQSPFMAGEDGW